jgi:lysozyme
MKPSKTCIEIVEHFEGFYANAYKCPAGIWTIGIGTIRYPNGKPVMDGDVCTRAQAEEYLMHELEEKARGVERFVTVELNQDQFDALVSFAYNVGLGAFEKSTMLGLINIRRFKDAAGEFMRWNKGGGKVLPGLTRRRSAERALFLSQNWKEFLA